MDEKSFWDDVDKHMIGPDFDKIKRFENDILGELPYTDEELAEIFEELNEEKDENRKKRNL